MNTMVRIQYTTITMTYNNNTIEITITMTTYNKNIMYHIKERTLVTCTYLFLPLYLRGIRQSSSLAGAWHDAQSQEKATLEQSDTWRKERRLRLHHAGLAHLVDMVNNFANEDKYIRTSMY